MSKRNVNEADVEKSQDLAQTIRDPRKLVRRKKDPSERERLRRCIRLAKKHIERIEATARRG